ncbi:MaoC domain-containing protein dehydratase [Corallococcus coralloides DSM 2259]|uniref:MaoC domain-containing protein dehydratase n=1 Tax=Corallococcus coralloides (strain ATCC 25202 / DSM 2259 / NBRC 100086 / M2) TaxID=1144275 RepID=H8N134_CORCM|nr:MaoC/PaaZ C-terminal domain-containing protein [Corallococcus coralloides]AFE07200.1 MaoC domain-containing protein dehydratase [Corallococcus coralloides DSM 2259]
MTQTWEALQEGQALPPARLPCGRMDIIRYAAASGDFNPAHLEPDAVESRELGRIIVPGRYKHARLGRFVTEWLGPHGRLVRLCCLYTAADTVGEPLTCQGQVGPRRTEGGRRLCELLLWIENARGHRTTRAEATVEWVCP